MRSKSPLFLNASKTLVYLAFVLIFLGSRSLAAQYKMGKVEADALRSKVKALSATTETITSDFIQYKHLDFLSNDIESRGKLAFKAPDRVKWEYTKPFTYSVIFKDQTLYIDDNGNKSAMDMASNKIFKQLNQLITASIKGDLFDAEEFTVSYYTKEQKSEVHFDPTDPQFAEFITSFQLTFNNKGEVQEVKMIEPSEDYTLIIFSNRNANQPLSDAVFNQ
jgi:outer membrane lipoprotein carrier protein